MVDVELMDDLRNLHGALQVASELVPHSEREEAFTRLVLDHLNEIGRIENGDVALWEGPAGRGVGRVSGYGLGEDADTLDLFISDLGAAEEVRTAKADDLDRLVAMAGRFAEHCLKLEESSPADTAAGAMIGAIRRLRGKLRRVRIFVLTDAVSSARRLPKREIAGTSAEIDVWDLTRLVRSLSVEGGGEPIDIEFEDSSYGSQPFLRIDSDAEHSTLLMIVPGKILAELYEDHGAALLEFNVRSFLSVRGKVNKGIRQTILNNPERFIAYNNGIVITAESFYETFVPGVGKAVARLKNVQIVNGGQTTATIHDTAKRLEADVSRVAVAAKIVIVGSEIRDDMVKEISKFANTQNPMQQADLSANEPFHVSVERLSRAAWCPGAETRWFYERARGQYDVELSKASDTPAKRAKFLRETPKEQKFSKVDLAKLLHSWDRKPFLVSNGGQKNFTMFMEELRRRNGLAWEPDQQWYQDVVSIALIWSKAEQVVRWEGVPAFRANVVPYLVSCLSSRSSGRLDLQQVWNRQGVTDQLEALLRSWVLPIRDALVAGAVSRQKNPTEWFKKEECWQEVDGLMLPLQDPLPPELAKSGRAIDVMPGSGPTLAASDLQAVRRIKAVDARTWISIAEWGTTSTKLHWTQTGIATTSFGYVSKVMAERADAEADQRCNRHTEHS